MDAFDRLVGMATEHVEGPDANRAMWEARERLQAEFGRAVFYEIVADAEGPEAWERFMATQLVKLADHMKAKRVELPGARFMLILIWRNGIVHQFDAPAFWRSVAEIAETDVAALIERTERVRRARDEALASELRRPAAGRPPPPALPAPLSPLGHPSDPEDPPN
jgi:hypothetical protein